MTIIANDAAHEFAVAAMTEMRNITGKDTVLLDYERAVAVLAIAFRAGWTAHTRLMEMERF
jgi:hypothetical protein